MTPPGDPPSALARPNPSADIDPRCPDPPVPGPEAARQILVLGLGNSLMRDDAAGLEAARRVRPACRRLPSVIVSETEEMGLSLLDVMAGYRGVILVDAVCTRRQGVGKLWEQTDRDLASVPEFSPHFLGVGEVLRLGRALGMAMPGEVRILGIEVADPWTVGHGLTPMVEAAIPRAAARILAWLEEMTGSAS
ncbi:MAG: hydrogenase maturation protease [Verrucomicrobia bacterium]|nr:hydrogenase maturation protease [Verrucomicrobiota bacterium]